MNKKEKCYIIAMYVGFIVYTCIPIIRYKEISIWNNCVIQIFDYWKTGLSITNMIVLFPYVCILGIFTYQYIAYKKIHLQRVWCTIAVVFQWFISDGVGLDPEGHEYIITAIILLNNVILVRMCIYANQFTEMVYPIKNIIKNHLKKAIAVVLIGSTVAVAGYQGYQAYVKYDRKHLRIELQAGNGNAEYFIRIEDEKILKETHTYVHNLFYDYDWGWVYKGLKPGKTNLKVGYSKGSLYYEAIYKVTVDEELNITCEKEDLIKIKEWH